MTDDDPVAAIDAIREAFEAAENRGDPSIQIDHRDQDEYVRMPPDAPPMDFSEAASAIRELYATRDLTVEWESDGVLVSGDLAVDSGQFTIELGEDPPRRGSWVLVYRQHADGRWLVVRDIFNWDEAPE